MAPYNQTKSILKAVRSPKSLSPKKVRFADQIEDEKRISMWYHIDSPIQNSTGALKRPARASHTKQASEFFVDLDDEKDFGPKYDPHPGFFADWDYDYDYDAVSEDTIWSHCCTIL